MALNKITDAEMDAAGVCAAPDVLSGTPAENKKVFDRMVRQLVAPAYNAAVDAIGEIEDTEAGVEAEEAAREQAEATRKENESQRQTNEQARQTAEQARNVFEDYAADKAYVPGNKVAWQGSSYVCTAACTGIAPPDAAHWLLMAKKGTDGATMPAAGLFGFDVDPDTGQLRLYYTGDTPPDFSLDADGHLIYKLSPDVSVDIGVVKGADGDTTLDITGASVGQVARVQEVDSDGRPIKWEAASVSAGVGEIYDESSGISVRYPEKMTIQVAQASRWGRLVQVVLQIVASEDIPVNYGWIATLPRIANTRAWFSSTLDNNSFFVNAGTAQINCNRDVFPAGASMLFGTYLTNENVT